MYRPEGFNTDKIVRQVRADMKGCVSPDMYVEAGAEAMLEGLETGDHFIGVTNKAVTMPGFEATIDDTVRGAGDGLWVFIPEEESELQKRR